MMYVKQPKKLLIINILDILRKYTDEDHRLSQKEIADILKKYPYEVSGGQKQRVSIARIFLKNPPVLILDEATSYTDPENEAVIQSALARLVRCKTLLVIAHRLSTIADADQIIVVNQGKIEATGTQAELLASCPLYQAMWEAHISVKDDGEVA